jgi:hypothetical protein
MMNLKEAITITVVFSTARNVIYWLKIFKIMSDGYKI